MKTDFQKIIVDRIKVLEGRTFDTNVDDDGDEIDVVQCNLIAGMTFEQRDRNHFELVALRDALEKFRDNTYGICEECEEKIAHKRLMICPEAKHCIRCAEIIEKQQKQFIK